MTRRVEAVEFELVIDGRPQGLPSVGHDREAFEQAAAAYHGLTVESVQDARLSNGSYRQPTLARDWAFFQLGAAYART